MTREQLECLHQISETAGLLSRQLGNLVELFQTGASEPYLNNDTQQETIDIQGLPTQNELDKNTENIVYPPMYFGAPSGNGFEDSSQLPLSSVKCLYVILKKSETRACYYPIPEKLSRFKMNPNSLFNIVCIPVGDISEASSIEFTEDDYGELLYENGYWKVTKKCTVFCN